MGAEAPARDLLDGAEQVSRTEGTVFAKYTLPHLGGEQSYRSLSRLNQGDLLTGSVPHPRNFCHLLTQKDKVE